MPFRSKGEHDYSSQHGRGRARGGYRGREAKNVEEEEDDDNFLFMIIGTEKQEKMIRGHSLLFDDGKCVVKHKTTDRIVACAYMTSNRVFSLKITKKIEPGLVSKVIAESELWHQRYDHLYVKGLQLLQSKDMGVLELIHANLCGPMRTESLTRSKYFMLLTNDFSGMSWVYFLKYKSESFDYFKKFKALVKKQSERSIKLLRTDRGGKRRKLARKYKKRVFIGYCMQSKAYRLYEPLSKKINISRNVVFDEDAYWNWDDQKAPFESQGEKFITDVNQDIPSSLSTYTSPSRFVSSSPTSSPISPMVSSPITNDNNTVTEVTESVQLHRSESGRVPRRRFQIEREASSSQQA
nr:retrovirus-related Pol polyprotein from transposon TNT 1-94 [Tanacetum cinerariifolium]